MEEVSLLNFPEMERRRERLTRSMPCELQRGRACRAGGAIQRGERPRALQAEGPSQRGQASRTWCPQGSRDGWALVCIASTEESGSESSGELLRVWAGGLSFQKSPVVGGADLGCGQGTPPSGTGWTSSGPSLLRPLRPPLGSVGSCVPLWPE